MCPKRGGEKPPVLITPQGAKERRVEKGISTDSESRKEEGEGGECVISSFERSEKRKERLAARKRLSRRPSEVGEKEKGRTLHLQFRLDRREGRGYQPVLPRACYSGGENEAASVLKEDLLVEEGRGGGKSFEMWEGRDIV